jgi:hypothetical protein
MRLHGRPAAWDRPPPFGGAGGRGAVYRTTGYGRTVAWTAPYGARPGGHGREPCLRARAARADSRHGRLPPFEAVAESLIQQLHLKQPSTFLLRALPGGWADFTQRNKLWCGTERDGLWMSQFMRCVNVLGGVFYGRATRGHFGSSGGAPGFLASMWDDGRRCPWDGCELPGPPGFVGFVSKRATPWPLWHFLAVLLAGAASSYAILILALWAIRRVEAAAPWIEEDVVDRWHNVVEFELPDGGWVTLRRHGSGAGGPRRCQ